MDFKMVFNQKINSFKLYNIDVQKNLHHMVASYWKIHLKRFSYTYFINLDCDFPFTFSFWESDTFWADGFNSKVAQLDKTFHLIYILGVVQGLSSTSPSPIQVKVVSKTDFKIGHSGPYYPRDDR